MPLMGATIRHMSIAVTLVSGVTVGSLGAQSSGTPAQETFRSAVDVVTIQASVRDSRGRSLQGLTSADFEVRDNGQLRPVLSLRSDQGSPVSLAILVDLSGSMQLGSKLAMARRAFDSVLSQLRDGDDEVGLFTFDSTFRERHGFAADLARVRDAWADFDPFGNTSLYDATAATARQLADRAGTRKAIIVLTDGVDTSSMLTAAEVSQRASSIDVPVYVVATVLSIDHDLMVHTVDRDRDSKAADLRDLAAWTGGRLVFASTFEEAATAASAFITELREQYVLAIEAAAILEWRRLDVRVKRSSAIVKARSGYFGG